jgi:hypothetical protein
MLLIVFKLPWRRHASQLVTWLHEYLDETSYIPYIIYPEFPLHKFAPVMQNKSSQPG